ncbi:MAG: DUF1398 domain-containing protein [Rhodopseudomonas sp.]|nr:DUF1398 domain-containing protein [Rhodopseudomonas sp.]
MNTDTIVECMRLSFDNTPFPAVVQKLGQAGVHAYTADLIALRNTYYDATAESFDEAMPLTDAPAIAATFDEKAVAQTIKAIQRGDIGYAEFLRRIMKAGCASYRVYFGGRKAVYFGRDGDCYSEPFPQPKH